MRNIRAPSAPVNASSHSPDFAPGVEGREPMEARMKRRIPKTGSRRIPLEVLESELKARMEPPVFIAFEAMLRRVGVVVANDDSEMFVQGREAGFDDGYAASQAYVAAQCDLDMRKPCTPIASKSGAIPTPHKWHQLLHRQLALLRYDLITLHTANSGTAAIALRKCGLRVESCILDLGRLMAAVQPTIAHETKCVVCLCRFFVGPSSGHRTSRRYCSAKCKSAHDYEVRKAKRKRVSR